MLKSDDIIDLDIRLIANTPEKREKGLMFAKPLEDNEVAFFIFPSIGDYGFWNNNVSFDLSLAFIDENNKIVDFADMKAHSKNTVKSNSSEIKYVIEAKRGMFNKLDVHEGDFVIFDNNKIRIRKI
jgi:uncharacterized membrane protein (UPF0127 family)